MLDSDLALLYGVSTKRLNQQVKRNMSRFPKDFLLFLTPDEISLMRSQFVTSSRRNKLRPPIAFTEHGAIMLASVLNSPVAVEASVRVVEAFVRMRELLAGREGLKAKLDELERRLDGHDGEIKDLFGAIRGLIEPPAKRGRKIGFSP